MIVTGPDDLDEEHLRSRLDDLTDLDIYLDIDADGLTVEQGPGSCTFRYPFDLQDVLDWTYHFENDYTVRHEILDDVQRLLSRHPIPGRHDQAIETFVHHLLLTTWTATDGSDLMIMDVDGQPLELSAHFAWTGPFTGDVERPYRAADHGWWTSTPSASTRQSSAGENLMLVDGEIGPRRRRRPDRG